MKYAHILFSGFIVFISMQVYSSDWPIYKGNLYFTGNNDEIIVKNNSLKWLFMASNYVIDPIVSDGRVYFSDLDKIVYCVSESDGKLVWKEDLKPVSSHFASAAGVPGKIKYPLVRGNFLFISDATAIYCLDKNNGKPVWARSGLQESNLKSAVIDGIYTDPILSGDDLYYGTRKNFIAREIYNGHVLWSNSEIESYGSFPTYYDNKILAVSRDYQKNNFSVFCLDRDTGKTLWREQIDIPLQVFPPVVYQGKVYVPSGKKLFCLSITNGSRLWDREYGNYITSAPGFTDREILLTIGNRSIDVLNPDNGEIIYDLDFGEASAPYFVTVNDQLYTAFTYKKEVGGKNIAFTSLRAYEFSLKTPLWEFQPPFPGAGTQPVASGGTLFLPAGNYLYAVGTYYEHPIVFGNDGNSSEPETESSASSAESISPSSLSSSLSPVSSASSSSLSSPSASSISSGSSSSPLNLQETGKGESVVVNNIYFEFDKAYLRRESVKTLDDIVRQLKTNPGIKLEIQGHTDKIGTEEYNRKLSERRADAVMEYFIKNGISPERLRSVGYGSSKPIAGNSTPAGRAKNRRTEFLILEK